MNWLHVHGISQARILEWVVISFSGGSSWPRDRTCIFCIRRWILSTEPPGKFSTKGYKHCGCLTISQPSPIQSAFTFIMIQWCVFSFYKLNIAKDITNSLQRKGQCYHMQTYQLKKNKRKEGWIRTLSFYPHLNISSFTWALPSSVEVQAVTLATRRWLLIHSRLHMVRTKNSVSNPRK